MKRTVLAAIVLTGLLFSTGAWAHKVYFKGIDGPGRATPVPPDAAISLQLDPTAVESDLNDEVGSKIERLLADAGYRLTSKAEADYLLFYDFDRQTFTTRTKLRPLSGTQSGMTTMQVEGPYDLSLSIRLVAKKPYEEEGVAAFTWAGGAALHTADTEGWRYTNLVLVAAFEHFLENTDKVVTVRKRFYDREVKELGPE